MKKLLIVVIAISMTSCASKWSCKKRYVNSKYEYTKEYKENYLKRITLNTKV